MNVIRSLLLTVLIAACGAAHAETAFTYQGRLGNAGQPAHGPHDFRFRLFDDASAGGQVGVEQAVPSFDVDAGIFTVQLDFGDGPFNAAPRWLEIAVRETGAGSYTTLAPRQRIGAAPFAIETLFVAPGAVDTVALQDNAVTSSKIASGAVTSAKLAQEAVDATKIAPDAVQPEHVAGGVMNGLTRLDIYERSAIGSISTLNGETTATARCDDASDIPVSGECYAGLLDDVTLKRFGPQDWEVASTAAGYSCTYRSNTASTVSHQARIHCLDVTP